MHDIMPCVKLLEDNGIIFRGEDIPGQILFVMGDFEKDVRTHHIHVVKWNSIQWKNYINFRDYLNTFPEKAAIYHDCKKKLEKQFSNDRKRYTAGKQSLIEYILKEAGTWRSE